MAFLSKKVFEYRLKLMRKTMAAQGLDALAFLTPDFFQFATNFHVDVQPWERPIVVVVPAEGAPFAALNELSTNHVRYARDRGTLWLDEIQFWAEHPRIGTRVPLRPQWPEMVAELLRGHGLARGRIGVDQGGGLMQQAATLLPELKLVPSLREMRELRFVKCPEEIAVHREAARLSDWAQDHYRAQIRPGRLVQEVDLAIATLIVEEAARRFPGENIEPRCWTLSGAASASPHGDGAPTGARFGKSVVVVTICNVRMNGMTTENERTFFTGKPSNRQVALYEAAAQPASLAARAAS